MTPAGTSNEPEVQNDWEKNTHNTDSVQYNGGFLPEIMLLTLCDSIGEPFNTIYYKVFVLTYSQCSHLNLLVVQEV